MFSKAQFDAFTPYERGYVTYHCGRNDEQENIPDEDNPYPEGSDAHADWEAGQLKAVLDAQDSDA